MSLVHYIHDSFDVWCFSLCPLFSLSLLAVTSGQQFEIGYCW